jgi:hypothetical protein
MVGLDVAKAQCSEEGEVCPLFLSDALYLGASIDTFIYGSLAIGGRLGYATETLESPSTLGRFTVKESTSIDVDLMLKYRPIFLTPKLSRLNLRGIMPELGLGAGYRFISGGEGESEGEGEGAYASEQAYGHPNKAGMSLSFLSLKVLVGVNVIISRNMSFGLYALRSSGTDDFEVCSAEEQEGEEPCLKSKELGSEIPAKLEFGLKLSYMM